MTRLPTTQAGIAYFYNSPVSPAPMPTYKARFCNYFSCRFVHYKKHR